MDEIKRGIINGEVKTQTINTPNKVGRPRIGVDENSPVAQSPNSPGIPEDSRKILESMGTVTVG